MKATRSYCIAVISLTCNLSAATPENANHSFETLYLRDNIPQYPQLQRSFSHNLLQSRSLTDEDLPSFPYSGLFKRGRSPSPPPKPSSGHDGKRVSNSPSSPPQQGARQDPRRSGSPRTNSPTASPGQGGSASGPGTRKRKPSPDPGISASRSPSPPGAKRQRIDPPGASPQNAGRMPPPPARDFQFTGTTVLPGTTEIMSRLSPEQMNKALTIGSAGSTATPAQGPQRNQLTGRRPTGPSLGNGSPPSVMGFPVVRDHGLIASHSSPAGQAQKVSPDALHRNPVGSNKQQLTVQQLHDLFPPDPKKKPPQLSIDRPSGPAPKTPPNTLYHHPFGPGQPRFTDQQLKDLFPPDPARKPLQLSIDSPAGRPGTAPASQTPPNPPPKAQPSLQVTNAGATKPQAPSNQAASKAGQTAPQRSLSRISDAELDALIAKGDADVRIQRNAPTQPKANAAPSRPQAASQPQAPSSQVNPAAIQPPPRAPPRNLADMSPSELGTVIGSRFTALGRDSDPEISSTSSGEGVKANTGTKRKRT